MPVQISINGIGAEPGGSTNVGRLLGLTADDIQTIFVGRTFISITTRSVPRSVERSLESGIIHLGHPGYYTAREFAEVTKNFPTDVTSTILWQPDIEIDEKGQANIFIDKNRWDDKEVVIVVEGVSDNGEILSLRM